MKKRLKSFLILFILLFLCGCHVNKKNNPEPKASDGLAFSFDNSRTVHICDDVMCPYTLDVTYPLFKLNTDNYDILDKLESINNATIEYYNKTMQSKLGKDETCGIYGTDVFYSYISNMDYFYYADDEMVVFGVQRDERNICTDSVTRHIPEVFIYDLVNKKYMSQNDFKKKYAITDERMESAAWRHVKNLYFDKSLTVPAPEDMTVLLDDNQGMVIIFYIQELGFYTVAPFY